jgi:hypothetical protein
LSSLDPLCNRSGKPCQAPRTWQFEPAGKKVAEFFGVACVMPDGGYAQSGDTRNIFGKEELWKRYEAGVGLIGFNCLEDGRNLTAHDLIPLNRICVRKAHRSYGY